MSVKQLLDQLGLDPKKSLGQNFMVQPGALDKMVEAAGVGPDDVVLEIGAGLGMLTDRLAERARRVVAVEIDERFIPYLRDRYDGDGNVEIVHADILRTTIDDLLGEDACEYKVVANLPYYITTAILRMLLEEGPPPQVTVITVQREVAERMVARDGMESLLSISVRVYGEARIITHLKAGNFYPEPKIQSSIVRVEPRDSGPLLPPDEVKGFFTVVRAGFSQPRKQVKNALAAGLHLDGEDVVNWLAAAGIDPRRRAETIRLDEWLRLYRMQENLL